MEKINLTSCEEIVEEILDIYKNNDICLGEILEQVVLSEIPVQKVVDIFGTLMGTIEGDELIHRVNTGDEFTEVSRTL